MNGRLWLRRLQFWAAVFGILGFWVVLFKVIWDVRRDIKSVQKSIEAVEDRSERSQLRLVYPINGSTVELTDWVRGSTPYSERNHYIVVTPVETGDDWVQDIPVKVSTGGVLTGRASFGTAAAGPEKRFLVRAMASRSALSAGPLIQVPEDAIFSEAIIVTRRR